MRGGPRYIPLIGANGSPKMVVVKLPLDASATGVQRHPVSLQIDPSLHRSLPTVLKASHELTVLYRDVKGPSLKKRDSICSILPGPDDALTVKNNFARGTRRTAK